VSAKLETQNLKSSFNSESVYLKTEAKSFVIYDAHTGKVLISKNKNEKLPLASLSKIISIGAYLDYKKSHDETISTETLSAIKEILIESDNIKLEELGANFELKYNTKLLTVINEFLRKNGLQNITMQNLTGLDIDNVSASNFGDAESVARVFTLVYSEFPEIFSETKFDRLEDLTNTNQTAGETYGLLASKTGFTDLAGGNLSIISSPAPGEKYVLVVIGSTKEMRFKDIQKLNDILPIVKRLKVI
jgi:D-alanyl-D-alanine carboxypeptidase (penicillin-binding protein 5/6)